MRPLTDVVPKPALPVLDVCLGAFGLVALVALGGRVIVNASHLPDELARCLTDPLDIAGRIELTIEKPLPYGTAGTLRSLGDLGHPVLTCNADLITDLEPATLLAQHEARGAACTLAAMAVGSGADFALEDGAATRFVDRRREPEAPGARFAGMGVFGSSALGRLPTRRPAGLGETLIPDLVASGEASLFLHDGYAYDVAGPADLLEVSELALEGNIDMPLPPPGRIVEVDGGRSYVGPGASVPEGCLGPGAVVLREASVEPGVRLERCIVWERERVAGDQRVRDAVWFGGNAL